MKVEERLRERYAELIAALKRHDVLRDGEHKLLVLSAILREYDWIFEDE